MATFKLIQGDCIEVMRSAKAESVDVVICDPPYGISFMGKDWDKPQMLGQATGISGGFNRIPAGTPRPDMSKTSPQVFQEWTQAWATEALRVLKPGGHILAFGATKMQHRLASGIEDAGFEIRDMIAWMYGTGMPKGRNVAKAIDARILKGSTNSRALRQVEQDSDGEPYTVKGTNNGIMGEERVYERKAAELVTDEAKRWEGWNTALKPAIEPIIVARKPMTVGSKKATVDQCVMEHGTGAMNIDAMRVGGDQGRWPANMILDESAAEMLDDQTGIRTSGKAPNGLKRSSDKFRTVYGAFKGEDEPSGVVYGDTGGASRFFFVAKPSTAERKAGVEEGMSPHTTVKPIALMRYLVRGFTPPGGVVLDCFMGSGTTGIAAVLEGFKFVGIELDGEHVELSRQRIEHWKPDGRDADLTTSPEGATA